MLDTATSPKFIDLLTQWNALPSIGTEDVIAAVLPLIEQVQHVHAQGQVAPLQNVDHIFSEGAHLFFHSVDAFAPTTKRSVLGRARTSSKTIRIVDEVAVVSGDEEGVTVTDRSVSEEADTKPRYLTGYRLWEVEAGHHDPLTDIFGLGIIIASLATGLNFGDREQLEAFVRSRTDLQRLNRRLHPVLCRAIERMTALERYERAQDLGALRDALQNFRSIGSDFREALDAASPATERRETALLKRLRARLYDTSRRNRMVYHRPVAGELNLTETSVPLVIHIDAIREDALFTARSDAIRRLVAGQEIVLGDYLRFEEMLFAPSVLDKLRTEAARSQREFGGSPLRLIPVMLHWYDLKNDPEQPIASPLLLLRATLKKRKGVRDVFVLNLESAIADVNPALAHVLEQLYGIKLPATVDMADSKGLDTFFHRLKQQIQITEPGIVLSFSDKPKMRLLHRKARRRLDTFHRRTNLSGKLSGSAQKLSFSYKSKGLDPLGVKLFRTHVALAEAPLRSLAGRPLPRLFNQANMLAENLHDSTEKETRFLQHAEETSGRFDWSFNLCAVTLANFNYRKMSLVRDFDALVQEPAVLPRTFGLMFGDAPRLAAEARADVAERDKFTVVSCDPTQESAVLTARSGQSYVIQGPPGTGKSQTITNLIADFVGRGKRVLFVCEKRAALDVVHNRLKGAGLGDAAALFHDSQNDRAAFVRELSALYTGRIEGHHQATEKDVQTQRAAELTRMDDARESIRQLVTTMSGPAAGSDTPVHELLAAALANPQPSLALGEDVLRQLPSLKDWTAHREHVLRAIAGIKRATAAGSLKGHPASLVSQQIWAAEDLVSRVESAAKNLVPLIHRLAAARPHLVSLPEPSLSEAVEQIRLAAMIAPAARADRLDVFATDGAAYAKLGKAVAKLENLARQARTAASKAVWWKHPFTLDEALAALAVAEAKEQSFFSFLSGDWRRTKASVWSRVDVGPTSQKPTVAHLLRGLIEALQAEAKLEKETSNCEDTYGYADPSTLMLLAKQLAEDAHAQLSGARQLYDDVVLAPTQVSKSIIALAAHHANVERTVETLTGTLDGLQAIDLAGVPSMLDQLATLAPLLRSLQPVLAPLAQAPRSVWNTISALSLDVREIDAAVVDRALRNSFDANPQLDAVDADTIEEARNRIHDARGKLAGLNAKLIDARMIERFRDQIILTNTPDRELDRERREVKGQFAKGRRVLENEFSKTRAYKSPRELLASEAGSLLTELKPVWLMSPLSVADVLPLDGKTFDVVIFDEASQIPVEEALPTLVRASQVIVVGDDKQLPPTDFFGTAKSDEDSEEDDADFDFELGHDSLLRLAAAKMPGTMLGWHYRSRSEELIGFSNSAFYDGKLLTVPSVRKAHALSEIRVDTKVETDPDIADLLRRPVSFHYVDGGVYSERRNSHEAAYIARTLRAMLSARTGKSIGIVAFSEAQQSEIESAIDQLAAGDTTFAELLAAEREREANGEFVGLLVKNLENVQGDERDIIILSICYGQDAAGRMLMNFGPINKGGGEKRLNVIFSRAKENMMVISSIRPDQITNDYNIGANTLKSFLSYAEALSAGNETLARLALARLSLVGNPNTERPNNALMDALATRLASELGCQARAGLGFSTFRIDIALHRPDTDGYALAILIDGPHSYANRGAEETLTNRATLLEAFGWRVVTVPMKDLWQRPGQVIEAVRQRFA